MTTARRPYLGLLHILHHIWTWNIRAFSIVRSHDRVTSQPTTRTCRLLKICRIVGFLNTISIALDGPKSGPLTAG